MKQIKILCVAGLLSIAVALLCFESNLLWKVQELSLFQTSSLFFNQQMVVPGGMLTYCATFLTQFLYYPWLGVALISGCWLLLMWLTARTFRISDRWLLLTLVPVVLLLITIVDQGYWLYILKLRGHFFVATLGTLIVTALLWAFRSLPDRYFLRAAMIVVTAVVGYPLAGVYGLIATLLMGVMTWRLGDNRQKGIVKSAAYSLLAMLMVVAVPLLCYRHLYHETNIDNIFWAELPLYTVNEEYHQYYIPFILLVLFYAILAATYSPRRAVFTVFLGSVSRGSVSRGSVRRGSATAKPTGKKQMQWLAAQLAIVAVLVATAYTGWYKDENFHHELKMQRCIEQLDWEGVLAEARTQVDEPTRAIVMMRNLALSRLGRQGNEMYHYKNGKKPSDAPFTVSLMLVVGPTIYYQYGMTNYSIRYSMEMGVEYGWRAQYLKNMTRCAMLNGEWQVARKYINLLKQTCFHGDWAKQMEQLIGRRDLIAKSPEMGPVTHMMHYMSRLYIDHGRVEECIMGHLAAMRTVDDPYYQEQALLASMWAMNPQVFWYHFGIYMKQHRNQQIPIHYQEAAYLFGVMQNLKDVINYPFSPVVKETYARFDQMMARYDGQDIENVKKALEPMFGNTYFYQFYFLNDVNEF